MMMGRQPRPQMVYMPPPPYQPVSFIFPFFFLVFMFSVKLLDAEILSLARSPCVLTGQSI